MSPVVRVYLRRRYGHLSSFNQRAASGTVSSSLKNGAKDTGDDEEKYQATHSAACNWARIEWGRYGY